MSAVVDIRLVRTRDGIVRATVEGRPVDVHEAPTLGIALDRIRRAIEGASWTTGRDEVDEVRDEKSALYERRR